MTTTETGCDLLFKKLENPNKIKKHTEKKNVIRGLYQNQTQAGHEYEIQIPHQQMEPSRCLQNILP